MKNNCNFSDQIWDSALKNSADVNAQTAQHLANCDECAHLSNQIIAWKTDSAIDNPYLAQKIFDRISSNDIQYSKTNRFVVRLAFSMAIFIGVIIGFVSTITPQNQSINPSSAETLYRDKINTYSDETYYSEIKTEETQVLLTDLN